MEARVVIDIVLASAANGLNQADRNIAPIASIPMAEAFGWDMMQRGFVISAFAYGYILTQLPSGYLAAHVPPLMLLVAAVFGWSLATTLIPTAARLSFSVLLASRVVMGVFEGFCLPAIFQLFSTRVPAELRARAFATMLACGSVGQLVALLVCPLMASANLWPCDTWNELSTRRRAGDCNAASTMSKTSRVDASLGPRGITVMPSLPSRSRQSCS